ncbi:MAG: ABC transporter permease [Clostridia bacterium]|nr:ABC transporter permease [Clostridia bacterium]
MNSEAVKKPAKTPLLVVSKRDALPLGKRILIRAAALVFAIVICALIILIVGKANPFLVFAAMFRGFFINILPSVYSVSILLGISLAVTPAFRMKFWNIGAEGQALVGALTTAIIMIVLGGKLPDPVVTVIMLVGAVAAGMLWGVIPAVFKAQWRTNETLFTLMMNYIAIEGVNLLLEICGGPSHVVGRSLLANGRLPSLFNEPYIIPIVVALILAVVMFFYLRQSKQGYEISVVGESENTAKYIGINVKKVIIRTMAISGAICGLIGFLIVGGVDYGITTTTIGGRGFTAIMVSWLSKFNPFIMILTSFMIVFLEKGANSAASKFSLIDANFSNVLIGIILFFLIGCEFFLEYRVQLGKTSKEVQK